MTVRQTGQQTFEAPKARVAEQVRGVLKENPAYRDVREPTEGTVFMLNIKPSGLLIGPDMEIVLQESGSGTIVTATVTSFPLMTGGGSYYRYVRDFLAALRNSLNTTQSQPITSGEPVYRMRVGWVGAVFRLILTILLFWFAFNAPLIGIQVFVLLVVIVFVVDIIRMTRGGRLGV